MADDEALQIFPQIQALVSDKLQVVSYKWLSRNFLVSSNHAKRLLQQFAEQFENELKVIYVLSGWSVSDPKTYIVKLALSSKLAEVKQEFEENCSVQVYSVQTCIPDDLAAIWNTEFIQAEGLFNQPWREENCLRDNRFGGISNPSVKRNVEGKQGRVGPPRCVDHSTRVDVASKSSSMIKGQSAPPQPFEGQSKPGVDLSCETTVEENDKATGIVGKTVKLPDIKETTTATNISKKKVKNDKAPLGSAGSIANLWGRASTKPKAQTSTTPALAVPVSAEAQIYAQEAADAASSEDDRDMSIKRESSGASSRKRRVIFDLSDDDDNGDVEDDCVVSLASPDPSKVEDELKVMEEKGCSVVYEENSLNTREEKVDELKVCQKNVEPVNSAAPLETEIKSRRTETTAGISLEDRTPSQIEQETVKEKKDQTSNGNSTSPKRRKVLKTHIDNRGREVTEVVWEGEAVADDKTEKNDNQSDTTNRPPLADKAPGTSNNAATNRGASNNATTNQSSKGGNKKPVKGGSKDAKQGNLFSFFKRV